MFYLGAGCYRCRQVCPHQMGMDGLLNLWIVKPGCSSRGRGIAISNRLERILGLVGHGAGARQARYVTSTTSNTNCTVAGRFVVQKYIERPLLIYNTKFDIRQWVLVSLQGCSAAVAELYCR